MPPASPDTLPDAPDGTVVVEAPTAEAALAEVTTRLGPRAEIVSATKVLRGGIGGFFAREHVQLRAVPAADRPAQPDAPVSPGGQLQRILDGLAAAENTREETFAEVLRRNLGHEADVTSGGPIRNLTTPTPVRPLISPQGQSAGAVPAVEGAVGQPTAGVGTPAAVTARAVTYDAPPGAVPLTSSATPPWSATNLLRLGLPAGVVTTVAASAPAGDGAWVRAVADALAPLCGALPEGPAVLVGPRAGRSAPGLALPVVEPPAAARGSGSFAAPIRDNDRNRAWLAWNRERRWLHLVVGGAGWRRLLFDEPQAVSWVGDDAVCDAVRCAAELGLVLGYGIAAGRRPAPRRADPMDIALAVRGLLLRR